MGMHCVAALALVWVASTFVETSGWSRAHGLAGVVQAGTVPAEVTVTDRHTEGSFPIPPRVVNESPPVLRLRVKKVVNPENMAFQILVYLAAGANQEKEAADTKIPVGNVGLFPADRPGAFLLRDTVAFEKLKASMPKGQQGCARLIVEIRRLHENKPWARVEVTFAPPEWIAEPGK